MSGRRLPQTAIVALVTIQPWEGLIGASNQALGEVVSAMLRRQAGDQMTNHYQPFRPRVEVGCRDAERDAQIARTAEFRFQVHCASHLAGYNRASRLP